MTIIIIIFFGCIIGSALTQLIVWPLGEFGYDDSVVYKFLTQHWEIGWGDNDGWVDFIFLRFKTGFYFDISVLSLVGMMISWYFLRYFR